MSGERDVALAQRLTKWFEASARDLPWRRQRHGYTALVAEAMLQQTQVSRVVDYFSAFLKRFPTVHALAAADEQQVLAAWQGLGYYRRARHLHAAARMIVEEFEGQVPSDVAQLMKLPGVGRYTAGAIASIVYGRAEPIVDGNVHRVLARLEGDGAMTSHGAWPRAVELVKVAARPGVFNEGLMELGATICTPRDAQCGACPVREFCVSNERGLQAEVPRPKRAVRLKAVHHHAVVIMRGGHVYLEQRPGDGLWSRMWQVPTVESDEVLDVKEVAAQVGVSVTDVVQAGQFVHLTTHRRITFHVFTARSRARRGVWRRMDDVADLPMSNAQKRVMQLAMAQCGRRAAVPS